MTTTNPKSSKPEGSYLNLIRLNFNWNSIPSDDSIWIRKTVIIFSFVCPKSFQRLLIPISLNICKWLGLVWLGSVFTFWLNDCIPSREGQPRPQKICGLKHNNKRWAITANKTETRANEEESKWNLYKSKEIGAWVRLRFYFALVGKGIRLRCSDSKYVIWKRKREKYSIRDSR